MHPTFVRVGITITTKILLLFPNQPTRQTAFRFSLLLPACLSGNVTFIPTYGLYYAASYLVFLVSFLSCVCPVFYGPRSSWLARGRRNTNSSRVLFWNSYGETEQKKEKANLEGGRVHPDGVVRFSGLCFFCGVFFFFGLYDEKRPFGIFTMTTWADPTFGPWADRDDITPIDCTMTVFFHAHLGACFSFFIFSFLLLILVLFVCLLAYMPLCNRLFPGKCIIQILLGNGTERAGAKTGIGRWIID